MPVAHVLVEGDLDAEILQPLFQGRPVVTSAKCSKDALSPRARTERVRTKTNVCYLRDRDFDHDPPDDLTQPVVDERDGESVLGWHWCRHEIENYLIDPAIVSAVTGWDEATYTREVVAVAMRTRHYQIARWVVGSVRRDLLRPYELATRPDGFGNNDFLLPVDLSEGAALDWTREHVSRFRERVCAALDATKVEALIVSRSGRMTESLLSSVRDALVWCSGKDILAGLEPWLRSQGEQGAGAFRARLRDWVRRHPDAALRFFPEWQSLLIALRR